MSGIDGAVLDEFTQGINTPGDGQQGYIAFADQAIPYPNLEYKSPDEAAQALKIALGQASNAKSPEPTNIIALGSHVLNLTLSPLIPYTIYVYTLRAQARVLTAMQWYAQRRLTILTGSNGLVSGSQDTSETIAGSGFTLAPGATGSTISLTVTSTTPQPATIFASITEIYRKTTPTP